MQANDRVSDLASCGLCDWTGHPNLKVAHFREHHAPTGRNKERGGAPYVEQVETTDHEPSLAPSTNPSEIGTRLVDAPESEFAECAGCITTEPEKCSRCKTIQERDELRAQVAAFQADKERYLATQRRVDAAQGKLKAEIRGLQRQNDELRAEVERMRPVAEAAIAWTYGTAHTMECDADPECPACCALGDKSREYRRTTDAS
jgi:hypothetical protein